MEASLFDSDEPAVDASFGGARRIALDDTSWVEVVPGWLTGADVLVAALVRTAGWEQRHRWMYGRRVLEPRLTATYPHIEHAPHPLLREAGSALSEHYGVTYDGLWINLYRSHHDSTGWHGDRTSQPTTIVPVLTLGAQRRFLLRPVAGGASTVLRPVAGDLVVMGGRCQADWRHAVPKQATPAGPRVSVNFSATAQR
ncbi:alpha-ketoglutarate-dependent dioxygenase AlkB [Nocardioides sp. C4-1]|uniref:alpha-ketoglutarate-dependent dioxygenase AlkB n=1 Tax=Nocardioides sp. C4-1 TaxID=3151851 RepID=UPI0032639C23